VIAGYGGRGAVDVGWDRVLCGRLVNDPRWQRWRLRKRACLTPFGWLRISGAYGLKCGRCQRDMGSGCRCDYEGPQHFDIWPKSRGELRFE